MLEVDLRSLPETQPKILLYHMLVTLSVIIQGFLLLHFPEIEFLPILELSGVCMLEISLVTILGISLAITHEKGIQIISGIVNIEQVPEQAR